MAARSTFTRTSGSVITSAWANSLRDHVVPYSGAADGTTDGMVSVNTTADTMHIGNGTIAATFGCYGTPPTWTMPGTWPLKQGTLGEAEVSLSQNFIVRQGREVRAWGRVTVGFAGSPTPSAGSPIYLDTNLPATSVDLLGTFYYFDSGTIVYEGVAVNPAASGTGTQRVALQANNNTGFLGQTPSFAAFNGDVILLNLSYIATAAA